MSINTIIIELSISSDKRLSGSGKIWVLSSQICTPCRNVVSQASSNFFSSNSVLGGDVGASARTLLTAAPSDNFTEFGVFVVVAPPGAALGVEAATFCIFAMVSRTLKQRSCF